MRLWTYKHYKGHLYEVLWVVLHTETQEKMVLYRAFYDCPDLVDKYGEDPLFVRPYDIFMELVDIDGEKVQRFEYLEK